MFTIANHVHSAPSNNEMWWQNLQIVDKGTKKLESIVQADSKQSSFVPNSQPQQQQPQINYNSNHPVQNNSPQFVHPSYQSQAVIAKPMIAPKPHPQQLISQYSYHPQPILAAQPVVVAKQPIAPFPIQKPVVSHTGQIIIENTLGGISFDCRFLPTGHWRDTNFCDVYHACVHGYQRKTYTCPIVGERTYFDEFTQRLLISKIPFLF